jgi:hypothetical protein
MCLQEYTTGPYPYPVGSSPLSYILFLYILHLRVGHPCSLFPNPHVCFTPHLILFDFSLVSNSGYEAPHCVIVSTMLLILPDCSEHPS